jgi:hypothetical protein
MYTSEVTYGNNIKKRLVDFIYKKLISSEYFVDIKEIKQILISILIVMPHGFSNFEDTKHTNAD